MATLPVLLTAILHVDNELVNGSDEVVLEAFRKSLAGDSLELVDDENFGSLGKIELKLVEKMW